MSERSYFLGIDFGHAKTRCSVLTENGGNLRVLDMFETDSYESILQSEDRYNKIIEDVTDHLKSNKLILKSFTSNLRCNHFDSVNSVAERKMFFPFKKVGAFDVRRCRNKNFRAKIKPDEKQLDASFHKYFIDGKSVLRPLGLKGSKLRVETTQFVTKTSEYLKLQNATMRLGCFLEEVVPSHVSYQTFLENLELSPNQHILLIDFGKKQTKVTVSNLYQVLAIENFEIGGDDFTRIIADELLIDREDGEKVKCAGLHPVFMKDFNFETSRTKKLARHLKNEVYVLLQMISNYLKVNHFESQHLGKIVLAGGGSKFLGVKEIIRTFFKTNCVGFGEGELKYQMNLYIKPEYYCSLGLAIHSFQKRYQPANQMVKKFSMAKYFRNSTGRLLYSD